ncbi:hypothetical protein J2S19_003425 [Metabacillus malikii]|uniref:Uncharacterized protein n=1 Tax=Metabacillus malikii TaxID=1504265 RepID=A0ABT9ZIN9_9BACI|nr:hypothetical protein [Metabacillus malikii]
MEQCMDNVNHKKYSSYKNNAFYLRPRFSSYNGYNVKEALELFAQRFALVATTVKEEQSIYPYTLNWNYNGKRNAIYMPVYSELQLQR